MEHRDRFGLDSEGDAPTVEIIRTDGTRELYVQCDVCGGSGKRGTDLCRGCFGYKYVLATSDQ